MRGQQSDTYVLTQSACLLFVDDDPILREFAQVSLATDAVEVETAADGVEGLAALESSHFDAVLLDLEMPRMDGFQLLSRMRSEARWRDLPVIVVTGREDLESIDRAYRAGATAFTVKPLNWRLLSYQIRFVLRARQSERDTRAAEAELRTVLFEQLETMERLRAHYTSRSDGGHLTNDFQEAVRALRARVT